MYQWCKAGPPHPLRAWSVIMCTQFTPPTSAQTCFYMCLNTRREQHKHGDTCRLSAHCRNTEEISCEAFWEQCADCQRCILSVILSSFSLKWIWDSQVNDLVPALSTTTVGAQAVETCWELISIGLDVHLFFFFFKSCSTHPWLKVGFTAPTALSVPPTTTSAAHTERGAAHTDSMHLSEELCCLYVILAVRINIINVWYSCCSADIRHSVRISGQCGGEGCKCLIRLNWQVRSLTSEGEAGRLWTEKQAACRRERVCVSVCVRERERERERERGGGERWEFMLC